jgi:hypothetical protein
MNQDETFEWLRQRSNRLDEVLAENQRLESENVRLALELARLQTKPMIDAEREGERVGDIMEMRLEAATLTPNG